MKPRARPHRPARPFRAAAVLTATLWMGQGTPGADRADATSSPAASLPAASTRQRVAALEARVAELEEALRLTRKAPTAPGRTAPGRTVPATPVRKPQVVRTAAIAALAREAKPGAADRELLDTLAAHIDERDGVALRKELQKLLTSGESGYRVLHDFFLFLDKDRHRQILFSSNYSITFGLVHLAMLHDVELAEFSHYYLIATRGDSRSYMRKRVYDFIPVFLEYHAGRFPDLEAAFRQDILEELPGSFAYLPGLFGAMKALGFQPPIRELERFFTPNATLQQIQLLIQYLIARNDRGAVLLLSRFARKELRTGTWKAGAAMRALARMTTVEARDILDSYLESRDRALLREATMAYFWDPRDRGSADIALRLLASPVEMKHKRGFVGLLRRRNAEVLAALRERLDEVDSDELKDLIRK